jgi:replicative DNA helicase
MSALPHAIEAERSILGAIILDNRVHDTVAGDLAPDAWYVPLHRHIYLAIGHLRHRGSVADLTTLVHHLRTTGVLDSTQGAVSAIAALVDGVPRGVNVPHYVLLMKEAAARRGVVTLARQLEAAALSADEPIGTVIGEAERGLLDLASSASGRRPMSLGDTNAALLADLERRTANPGAITGIPTGFATLDGLTYGWQRGDLIVVAARPSMGKTAMVIGSVLTAAAAGHRCVVFSLEMTTQQLEYRILSQLSGIPFMRLQAGRIRQGEYEPLALARQTMAGLPIYFDDREGMRASDIRHECRRLRSEGGLDVVVVDYVGLMGSDLNRRGATRNDEVADACRRLKSLAKELRLPVILVSQLNRGGAKRVDARPRMEDLRDSGRLEEDATIVLFLHHEKGHHSDQRTGYIDKHRNGPTGAMALRFEKDIVKLVDAGMESEGTTDDSPPVAPVSSKPRTSRRQRSLYHTEDSEND